jgi:hypothetical protein
VTRLLLPTESFVIGRAGALLAESIDGSEELLVARADGVLAFAAISEISASAQEGAAWRLLTGVGDILLPDGARTITREGPLTGSSIWGRVRRGVTVRLEVVSPADLPIERLSPVPREETYRTCLGAFSRPIIRIPREIDDSESLAKSVEGLLRSAKVRYRRVDHERWMVLVFEPVDGASLAPRVAAADEASALLMLTAWETGDPPISRTSLQDRALRRRLLASLASARRPFEVRWGPSYLPVEARVQALDPADRRPFVPVHAAFHVRSPARELHLATPGHLIVGLALIGPAAP